MRTILSIIAFILFNLYICELPEPDWHQTIAEMGSELVLIAMIGFSLYCDIDNLIKLFKKNKHKQNKIVD